MMIIEGINDNSDSDSGGEDLGKIDFVKSKTLISPRAKQG